MNVSMPRSRNAEPVKRLVLQVDAQPESTLPRIVALANAHSLTIEKIEDVRIHGKLRHKLVSLRGYGTDLESVVRELGPLAGLNIGPFTFPADE